jgi:hypothetical protein
MLCIHSVHPLSPVVIHKEIHKRALWRRYIRVLFGLVGKEREGVRVFDDDESRERRRKKRTEIKRDREERERGRSARRRRRRRGDCVKGKGTL